MSYKNFRTQIVAKERVDVVGWPEGVERASPHDIKSLDQLSALHDAWRSGAAYWKVLSNTEHSRFMAKLRADEAAGIPVNIPRKKRSDVGGTHQKPKPKASSASGSTSAPNKRKLATKSSQGPPAKRARSSKGAKESEPKRRTVNKAAGKRKRAEEDEETGDSSSDKETGDSSSDEEDEGEEDDEDEDDAEDEEGRPDEDEDDGLDE
jgi:hypothetical protein